MTNTLVQELCKHITRLQADNEMLQSALAKHRSQFQELCQTAGCDSWAKFVEWAFDYFKDPSHRFGYTPTTGKTLVCNIQRLSKELFSESDLPSIQQQQQLTSPGDSLRTNGQIDCSQMMAQTAKWANETLTLSAAKHLTREDTLTAADYITIENGNLRRENSRLLQELAKGRQIIESLVYIIKSGEESRRSHRFTR